MASFVPPQVDHNLYRAILPESNVQQVFELATLKQQMYNSGVAKVQNSISNALDSESNMVSPYMQRQVKDFNEKANEIIKKHSTADFSIQGNVNALQSIYDPLIKDQLYIKEHVTSLKKNSTESTIQSYLNSEEQETRDLFHEDNYIVYNNKFNPLKKAQTKEEAEKGVEVASGAMYIPHYDPINDVKEYLGTDKVLNIEKTFKVDPITGQHNPGYLVKYKNGTIAEYTAEKLAALSISDKADQQFRISAEADLIRTSSIVGHKGAYMEAVDNGIFKTVERIDKLEALVATRTRDLSELGDRDDQVIRKQELQTEIDTYRKQIGIYDKVIEDHRKIYERVQNGEQAAIPQLEQLAIFYKSDDMKSSFVSNAADVMAYQNSSVDQYVTDNSYFKILEHERALLEINKDAASPAASPAGTPIEDNKLTQEASSVLTYETMQDYKNSISTDQQQVNSAIIDEYYGLNGKYHSLFQDLKASKYNTSEQTLSENNDTSGKIFELKKELQATIGKTNPDLYEQMINTKLKFLLANNMDLKMEDGTFIDENAIVNPMVKDFLRSAKSYYEEDQSVNLEGRKTELFDRYDKAFDRIRPKKELIERIENDKDFQTDYQNNLVEELQGNALDLRNGRNIKLVTSTGTLDNVMYTDIIGDNGEIDRKKIEALVLRATSRDLFTNSKEVQEMVDKSYDFARVFVSEKRNTAFNESMELFVKRDPEIKTMHQNLDLSQKYGMSYGGNEATKFMKPYSADLSRRLSQTKVRVDNGTDGLVTDLETPVITSPWFKDLNSDDRKKAINIIQTLLGGESFNNVIINGDGSLDMVFNDQLSTVDKSDEQNNARTKDLSEYKDDSSAKKIIQLLKGEGVRIDNFKPTETLTTTNPIVKTLLSKPGTSIDYLSNASKSFNGKLISSKNVASGGFSYNVHLNYMSIGGHVHREQPLLISDIKKNLTEKTSLTKATTEKKELDQMDIGVITDPSVVSSTEANIDNKRKIHNFVNSERGREELNKLIAGYETSGSQTVSLEVLERDILSLITK